MLNKAEIKRILFRRIKPPIKFAMKVFRMAAFRFFPIQWEALRVKQGYRYWKQIREQYGADTHIFFLRGGTGDVYLANLLLPTYIKQRKIEKYVLVGNASALKAVSKLFGVEHIHPIDRWKGSRLQSLYKVCGSDALNMSLLLTWQPSMYFNRCRTRMQEGFTYMDTYQSYVFDFDSHQELMLPDFCVVNEDKQAEWRTQGIEEGRTVIISPYAYAVSNLPDLLWQKIVDILRNNGYHVLFSVKEGCEKNPVSDCGTYFFSYYESVPLLEFAGFFLGIRSGLCDIVSSTTGKMVVLFPSKLKKKNHNRHRSDKQFCGLRAMGLNNQAIEIDTPLLYNVEIPEEKLIDPQEIERAQQELLLQIAAVFPPIN